MEFMEHIEFTDQEFDELMEKINTVKMEKDDYIPSEEDVFDYITRYPERYYLYLLWYSEHKPKPQTEEEKQIIKKITKTINSTIKII